MNDIEQMILGEAGESWDYEDPSIDPAVNAAVETANAEKPDLWFAEKHLRQIRRISADSEMTIRAFIDEIARLQEMVTEINDATDSRVKWHQRQVEGFHRALEAEGKAGRKLTCPSGVSTLRKAQPEVEFTDESAFLEYVESEGAQTQLLTTPKPGVPSKGGVKKNLRVAKESGEPGEVAWFVDDDGVAVPGVQAVFRHDSHSVKVVER